MDDFVPTEEELLDARAALKANPNLGDADRTILRLARIRRRFGESRFHLHFGLRESFNRREAWQAELFQGAITREEFEKRMRGDATRPVDAEMIEALFTFLRSQLQVYSSFKVLIASTISDLATGLYDEQRELKIDEYAETLRREPPLYRQEMETLIRFLVGVRIEARLGCADLCGKSASSATGLQLESAIDNATNVSIPKSLRRKLRQQMKSGAAWDKAMYSLVKVTKE